MRNKEDRKILVQLLICSKLGMLEMKLIPLRVRLKMVVPDLMCLDVMGLDLMIIHSREQLSLSSQLSVHYTSLHAKG